jgi:hypothetical protein
MSKKKTDIVLLMVAICIVSVGFFSLVGGSCGKKPERDDALNVGVVMDVGGRDEGKLQRAHV